MVTCVISICCMIIVAYVMRSHSMRLYYINYCIILGLYIFMIIITRGRQQVLVSKFLLLYKSEVDWVYFLCLSINLKENVRSCIIIKKNTKNNHSYRLTMSKHPYCANSFELCYFYCKFVLQFLFKWYSK